MLKLFIGILALSVSLHATSCNNLKVGDFPSSKNFYFTRPNAQSKYTAHNWTLNRHSFSAAQFYDYKFDKNKQQLNKIISGLSCQSYDNFKDMNNDFNDTNSIYDLQEYNNNQPIVWVCSIPKGKVLVGIKSQFSYGTKHHAHYNVYFNTLYKIIQPRKSHQIEAYTKVTNNFYKQAIENNYLSDGNSHQELQDFFNGGLQTNQNAGNLNIQSLPNKLYGNLRHDMTFFKAGSKVIISRNLKGPDSPIVYWTKDIQDCDQIDHSGNLRKRKRQ